MTANPALQQFLQSIPLFSFVEEADMMDLLRLLRPIELTSGETLFKEGEPGTAMWVLGKGTEVSLTTTPKETKRPVVVAYARAGDTVGEMALIEDSTRSATALVVQGGLAHEISAVDFQTLRASWSPAAFKILRQLCVELCRKLRMTSDRVAPSTHELVTTDPLPLQGHATQEDLDAFPALKSLPSVVKLALSQKLRLVTIEDFRPIFAEGDEADAAYFLVKGEVTVGRGGKTLATLGPGSMFGIVAAIDGGTRSASVLATGPTRLLRLSDADFDGLFATGNRFAFHLVDLVARQLVQHIRNVNQLVRLPGTGERPAVAAPKVKPAPAPEVVVPEPGPTPIVSSIDSLAMELNLDLSPELPDDFLVQ